MGTVDDYLATLDPSDAAVIAHVYAVAREIVPDAEQGFGYGMPALVWRGKSLLSVMRARKHIGLYPFSGGVVTAVSDAVARVAQTSTAKGTIRFQPSTPLPDALLRMIVEARRDQILGAEAALACLKAR